MQYQSIIRLFNYCNIDCDNIEPGRIKKILTAEFSIASSGIISIDGFDYTKNDIFQELERDDFFQRFESNKLIWQNPGLLNCLEKNIVSFSDVSEWMPLKNNSELVHFISPYFAVSFDKIMRKFLDPIDFGDANRWLNLLVFIDNPNDEERALSGIRMFIVDTTKAIKNVNNTTYRSIVPLLNCWINQSSYAFLNNLPSALYKEIDDLLRVLTNFCVAIQHTNKALCYEISCQLVRVKNMDPNLYAIIQKNHEVYDHNVEIKEQSSWGIGKVIRIAFIIIAVIRLLFFLAHAF